MAGKIVGPIVQTTQTRGFDAAKALPCLLKPIAISSVGVARNEEDTRFFELCETAAIRILRVARKK